MLLLRRFGCGLTVRSSALLLRRSLGSSSLTSPLFSSDLKSVSATEIIGKKRQGEVLSEDEIRASVAQFFEAKGGFEDYQMTALLMAICLQGMTAPETAALTRALKDSGLVADLDDIPGHKADKHSTGGVGDKISLVLAPVAAACGLVVPMMSGRGLGHTGGTLDKLEAIPGFRVNLEMEEFKDILKSVGVAMIAPAGPMAPADARLYALRDVTSTVQSIALQTSSIMCKKLAENPESLVLDVKTGRGAFNEDIDESIELAQSMISVGQADGKITSAFITSMDQPLGRTVGNWLEVKECIDVMQGVEDAPADILALSLLQVGQMLVQSGSVPSLQEGVRRAKATIDDGSAIDKFAEMVAAQGGDASWVADASSFPKANHVVDVCAEADGYVEAIDAKAIGMCAVHLGAGRQRVEDDVDPLAGIVLRKKIGDVVNAGDVIATLHTNREESIPDAVERIFASYHVPRDRQSIVHDAVREGVSRPRLHPGLVSHLITSEGVERFQMEEYEDIMF